jgi:hypothetical protein
MTVIRNIIVNLSGQRRLVVHPEGGLHEEAYIEDFGWCIANATEALSEEQTCEELKTARQLLFQCAVNLM